MYMEKCKQQSIVLGVTVYIYEYHEVLLGEGKWLVR